MTRVRHYNGAQALPLAENKVVCLRCGRVTMMGQWPTGKRSKCSPGHTYVYLGNGATGRRIRSSGKAVQMSKGHPA